MEITSNENSKLVSRKLEGEPRKKAIFLKQMNKVFEKVRTHQPCQMLVLFKNID